MLQSLMSLSDEDVSAVIAAIHKYCGEHEDDLHSPQGRRTISGRIHSREEMPVLRTGMTASWTLSSGGVATKAALRKH